MKHPPGKIIDVDGQSLHVVVRGSGPTVVLCGGLGSNWFDWDDTAELLAAHHTVVVFDRPGFGLSEPPPRDVVPTVHGEASRIVAVLDALDMTEPAVLVGHSIAGYYAEAAARLQPKRVRGLLLLDSSAGANATRVVPRHLRLQATRAVAALVSRVGLQQLIGPRVRRVFNRATPPHGISQDTLEWVDEIYTRPTYSSAALVEDVAYPDMASDIRRIRRAHPLIAPVLVAAAHTGRPSPWGRSWINGQRTLAHSLRAQFTVVVPAHHHMMIDRPAEIAALITELV